MRSDVPKDHANRLIWRVQFHTKSILIVFGKLSSVSFALFFVVDIIIINFFKSPPFIYNFDLTIFLLIYFH
jgi:hypothetical protein